MAGQRLSMRKAREILRQKWCLGRSHRAVARSLGTIEYTIGEIFGKDKISSGYDLREVQLRNFQALIHEPSNTDVAERSRFVNHTHWSHTIPIDRCRAAAGSCRRAAMRCAVESTASATRKHPEAGNGEEGSSNSLGAGAQSEKQRFAPKDRGRHPHRSPRGCSLVGQACGQTQRACSCGPPLVRLLSGGSQRQLRD